MSKRKPTPATPAISNEQPPQAQAAESEVAGAEDTQPAEDKAAAAASEGEVANAEDQQPAANQTEDSGANPAAGAAEDGHPVEGQVIEGEAVEARILMDHLGYKANTVAVLTPAEAENCDGWADIHPAAVAYAKSLTE